MIPAPVAAFFSKWGLALAGLAIALIATFYVGKLHERGSWESRRAEQIQQARETERAGAGIVNTAESDQQSKNKAQLEKAHAELEKLRAQLARVPRCPVPRAVVRLLDGERMPAAAGSAAKPQAAPAPVDPDAGNAGAGETVECSAVIDHCAVNRVQVCEPNALQVEGLQQFYENLRRRYNTQP